MRFALKGNRKHIVQMDFMFLSVKERPCEIATTMSMIDIRTQYASAIYLPNKTVKYLKELARCDFVVQTDRGSTIKCLVRKVNKTALRLRTRTASTSSSQNNGSVERFHQTQVRTMRIQIIANFEVSESEFGMRHWPMP